MERGGRMLMRLAQLGSRFLSTVPATAFAKVADHMAVTQRGMRARSLDWLPRSPVGSLGQVTEPLHGDMYLYQHPLQRAQPGRAPLTSLQVREEEPPEEEATIVALFRPLLPFSGRFAGEFAYLEEMRADSVLRKRKKKMNKHKHRKRLKLNRHRNK